MRGLEAVDPFSLTADPEAYVPREATERALLALVQAVDEERRPAALTGPGGLGKTLLLHLVGERAGPGWRPVHLPYAALAPEELCAWVLATLGEDDGGAPLAALHAVIERWHEQGEGMLLLVDDAGALPVATARWLGELAGAVAGRFGLVVTAGDSGGGQSMAALGDVHVVRLAEPMSEQETADYLGFRLARAGVPHAVRDRFTPSAVRRLHAIAGGNPRRLHIAAADLLRGGSGEIPEDRFGHSEAESLAIPGGFVPDDA